MPLRLVVSLRGVLPPDLDGGARYLARALDLKKRAEALGATLCAWSALTFSFDFDPDELEQAAKLAVVALHGAPEERFGAGIAEGEMSVVGESSFAVLSWGPALVAAVALSRDARPGEVLIEPALFQRREVELTLLDGMVVDRLKHRLLVRADASPSMLPPSAPSSQAPTERAPLYDGFLTNVVALRSAPQTPIPISGAPESGGGGVPSDVAALFAGPPRRRTPTLPDISGEPQPEPLVQLAMEQLIEQLRETGEHGDLVERMTGLIALRRGATAEALRRLRDAAEGVKEPAQRARARLAYGVALATAGRTEAALLEALEALSHARAAFDAQGERACAMFIARLSAAAGHPDAAAVWAAIAARPA